MAIAAMCNRGDMRKDDGKEKIVSKDPAFLFYSSDFLTGVMDLTNEERGQYITLLCMQHQKGHLSDKTIRLSVGNVSVDVMSKFKQDENGLYFNSRLDREIDKRAEFVESRRVNGKLGGRPKKPSAKPNGKPNGKARNNLPENENENENINNKKVEFAEFVSMKQEEYDKLVFTHGESKTKAMIEILDNYKGSSGKKYKSDYRAILSWVVSKVKTEQSKTAEGRTLQHEYQIDI